jgi:hypothetical protein
VADTRTMGAGVGGLLGPLVLAITGNISCPAVGSGAAMGSSACDAGGFFDGV